MLIETIPVGQLETNCYLVAADEGASGVIFDPGAEADKIFSVVQDKRVKVEKIFLTHGHWDHIEAVNSLVDKTHAEVLIHKKEVELLSDPLKNLSSLVFSEHDQISADKTVVDGEIVEVGGLRFRVVHTPGHTGGSMSLIVGDNVFCGDLVFYGSIGRTDLPGGNQAKMHDSVHSKIMTLSDSFTIYPGHGPKTTVAWEREHNPYLVGGW